MSLAFRAALLFLVGIALWTVNAPAEDAEPAARAPRSAREASSDVVDAQPQLIRIEANVDGSGRILFRKGKAVYEHKHWSPPEMVYFDGAPWTNLAATPPSWADYGARLDLTNAWIVKRKGRDVIALEPTPDGFDLYLNDSPNGAAHYEVTIAVPRRTR
jgi:hypothetical protein